MKRISGTREYEIARLALKLAEVYKVQSTDAYAHPCAAWSACRVATMSRKLSRIYERICNEGETPTLGRAETKTKRDIESALDNFRVSATFNGDPRGCAVSIHFPDESGNGTAPGWSI